MMNLLMAWMTGGAEGLPIPYSLRADDGITLILLGCFFLSAYVLSRSRKFLYQLMRDFLQHRMRASIFTTSTASDMRYLLLLVLQACVLSGICFFGYFKDVQPGLLAHVSPGTVLGAYIGICLLYLFLKWLLYSFLSWIFLDRNTGSIWLESYSTLLYYVGFLLFPLALFIVYFDLGLLQTLVAGVILVVFTKILMFYKCLKLFCHNLQGCLYLILYFCALEIVPCLVLYQGMTRLNEFFIIKF